MLRFTRDLFKNPFLFSVAMVELDGDDVRISSRGKVAERDIVQVRRLGLSREGTARFL